MKKIGTIIFIGIFTINLLTGCGITKKEDSKEAEITSNTNVEVIKDQTVDVFKFENTSLIYMDGTSTLETNITNTSTIDRNLQEFKIIVKDKNQNEIITLTGFIGNTIKAGETKVINSYCGEDLTNATSIEYVIVN